MVTNSLEQLRSIIQVSAGKKTSLHSLEEYHYFRYATCAPAQHEHVFAPHLGRHLFDAGAARSGGSGPPAEPGLHPALAELQARNESGPLNSKEFPELGKFNSSASCTARTLKPRLSAVSRGPDQEDHTRGKKAYVFFRDRYQSHWSQYFDPIAARLSR